MEEAKTEGGRERVVKGTVSRMAPYISMPLYTMYDVS
jgi:hypothetical protein